MIKILRAILGLFTVARTTASITKSLQDMADQLAAHAEKGEARGTQLQQRATAATEAAMNKSAVVLNKAAAKASALQAKGSDQSRALRNAAGETFDDCQRARATAARLRELLG